MAGVVGSRRDLIFVISELYYKVAGGRHFVVGGKIAGCQHILTGWVINGRPQKSLGRDKIYCKRNNYLMTLKQTVTLNIHLWNH